jgi:methylated-DNA-protein-cysteine methyltransferase-like protein
MGLRLPVHSSQPRRRQRILWCKVARMTTGDSYRRIYGVVVRIPRGRVATYGQVAVLAGLPRQARLVGYALNVLSPGTRVPWHRVVNAKGQVSLRSSGLDHESLQTQLLEREGVKFVAGAISLRRFRWQPRGTGGGRSRVLA